MQVLQRGSFGGTYFRPIYSSVTKKHYKDDVWKEFPAEWFKGETPSDGQWSVVVSGLVSEAGQGLICL